MSKVQVTFEDLVDMAERGPALRDYEDRVRWFCETLQSVGGWEGLNMLVDARNRLRAAVSTPSKEPTDADAL